MKVVFCVYGYSPEAEPLQPWLTVHEVAKVLIESGWSVHLITDVDKQPSLLGLQHHYVKTMRPSNAAEIRTILERVQPDRVIVLATPLNLMLSSWYKYVRCQLLAFLSYPFYSHGELARALPHLRSDDLVTYGRHALVPKRLWANTLKKYFSAVIAQSDRTSQRVANMVDSRIVAHGLRAGLDLAYWTPMEKGRECNPATMKFLYVGSAKSIRGFDVLLGAFSRLAGKAVKLRILARGSTPNEVDELRRRIDARAAVMSEHVELVGGWMDRDRYREELRAADVAVLPFVLVPSELPVSVLECIACGTPVIATDIDGLPDAVGSAGVIVRSGSVKALAAAMSDLTENASKLVQLRVKCVEARKNMLDWPSVGHEWRRVLAL